MAEASVRVSGTVLSSLLFQHVNTDSDVEGVIVGEGRLDEQVTISDSQSDHIHIQETYNILKHVACRRFSMLSSSSGQVNMEELQKFLDSKQGNVIGWYRQRRNSEQQMSFREKLLHQNLKVALCNPHLIFMLMTPCQATPTGSTHKMEYSAFISHGNHFLSVPILVSNLGLLEQQAYWRTSAPSSSAGYCRTMDRHRFFIDGQLKEVTEVTKMNDTLQEELQRACREVNHSERLVETLQEEISALSRKLSSRQEREKKEEMSVTLDERNNVRLQDAVSSLLGFSPLFLSQTLTLQAFPIPQHPVSKATLKNSAQDSTTCRKRQREEPGRDRKCRRSRC